uniref:Lipoxygenase domain-containing protein n=1 Tax=Globisporangium ultimum (strain ATCC 200006 / CBS 805.95 / DAOM BR144) TaxID=431595 RepID=K3WR50_GLOUD
MALVASPSSAKLSIPLSDDYACAGLVNSTSHVIANEPRTLEVNGKIYPLNDGPVFRNGTLYAQQIMKQLEVIRSMANPKVVDIKKRVREIILSSKGDTRVTVESYHKVYAALEKANVIVQPKSIDNSDASFGAMRLGIKGYNLKLVRDSEYSKYIDHLSDAQVADACGWHSKSQKTQISGARKDHRIFVSDFSKHREYTDEAAQHQKYVPIHMMSIPVQVEMMRSMATNHPIYALLDYHFFTNFALEHLARTALFAAKSDYDQTMAFGASGSLRYIYQDFDKVSFQDDFPTDIEARGLRYLPIHRYAKYGKKYYKAVKEFVTSSRSDLIKLVTHLVFLNSVKHHFMNGAVTWHGSTAPYSTGAIWNKPLPTKKGVKVNPLDYAIPLEKVPELVSVNANFLRPVPRKYTALETYNAAPFTNEPKLTKPIAEFHNTMEALEKTIVEAESKEELPNDLIKPSLMPHFPFI